MERIPPVKLYSTCIEAAFIPGHLETMAKNHPNKDKPEFQGLVKKVCFNRNIFLGSAFLLLATACALPLVERVSKNAKHLRALQVIGASSAIFKCVGFVSLDRSIRNLHLNIMELDKIEEILEKTSENDRPLLKKAFDKLAEKSDFWDFGAVLNFSREYKINKGSLYWSFLEMDARYTDLEREFTHLKNPD